MAQHVFHGFVASGKHLRPAVRALFVHGIARRDDEVGVQVDLRHTALCTPCEVVIARPGTAVQHQMGLLPLVQLLNPLQRQDGSLLVMTVGSAHRHSQSADAGLVNELCGILHLGVILGNALGGQHEMAPIYTDANTASDQNQLVMETMKKVAERHDLVCLLHEKPFAGVNGSGKHVNWSLSTDTGKNLFSPGKTPSQNALFLLLLAAFLKGVDDYQELLRCSVAFAGNDHRLGAQEAPPAIISVFLGTDLEGIIDAIVGDNNYTAPEHKSLRIGVDVLPSIPQDTTDRNRTSPLAFTGNKFEFRMPGSSQSIAGPITILNAIMADELDQFYETLKDASDFTAALHKLIRDTFSAHRRIIFSGNGYEDAWIREAEKRGLANLRNTAEALPTYLLPKNIEMLTRQGVYSREEILSRHEVHIEKYCKVIRIEAGTLVDMVQHGILNAVSEYEATLCNTIVAKHTAAPELTCHVESSLANAIGSLNEQLLEETIGLKTALETVSESFSPEQLLHYYHDEVEKRMDDVRRIIDKLEVLTASKYWPYPTFCELLFSV